VALIGTVLSLLGIATAGYLTIAHYTSPKVLACSESGVVNCAKVTSSSYSVVLGLPVAVVGLAYFVVMLALQVPAAWRSPRPEIRLARVACSVLGAVSVLWLVYVELFRLDAICLYCTAVHVISVALFALTLIGTALVAPAGVEPS